MKTTSLVQEVPVLTESECIKARNIVHSLRPLWDAERFRLGAGISYYKPAVVYYATARQTNPILKQHFSWLYDQLLQSFSQHFGCPVAFRDDLAVPGFNIYCGPNDFSKIQYNVHIDLQYNDLSWNPPGSADFNSTMSFTLPIASPAKGSGLNIWPTKQSDLKNEQFENPDCLSAEQAVYQPYTPGVATIHDGKHYHQMSVSNEWQPADERITLQGHGLKQGGRLIVYG